MAGKQTYFASRWGILLALLGMAIGTGNIWRFPRVIGANGGAAFLIPYFIFLFTWAIPLLLIEFGIGKRIRRGPASAFATMRPGFGPLGLFVSLCTMVIMFYYAVVTGWCLKYLTAASGARLYSDPQGYWNTFLQTSWQVGLFQVIAIGSALWIVYKGVRGIERANKILMPALFILLALAALRAVLLPGASAGLRFLFRPDFSLLLNANTWLEALAQVAWSTGAGWGLVVVYSIYMRPEEDIAGAAGWTALGDAAVALLAATAILPTVFAVLAAPQARAALGASNTGLTFIWIPQLFQQVPLGRFFLFLFFGSLFFAALSSLIAMVELSVRTLQDLGVPRTLSVGGVGVLAVLAGLPSALNVDFLNNQDGVWSIGLLFNGLFFALLVIRCGVEAFRQDFLNTPGNRFVIGRWFRWLVQYGIPLQFVVLMVWWLSESTQSDRWWNPLQGDSVGNYVGQIVLLLGVALALSKLFRARLRAPAVSPLENADAANR
ncbi:MAG: sodium-dependent transporter [Terriglobia bacterium]